MSKFKKALSEDNPITNIIGGAPDQEQPTEQTAPAAAPGEKQQAIAAIETQWGVQVVRGQQKTERTQLLLTKDGKKNAKKRAKELGVSLNEYILQLIEQDCMEAWKK